MGNGPAENRVTELEPFCSYFSLCDTEIHLVGRGVTCWAVIAADTEPLYTCAALEKINVCGLEALSAEIAAVRIRLLSAICDLK